MKKSSLTILLIVLTASIALFSGCSGESDLVSFAWQNHAPCAPYNPSPIDSTTNNPAFVTLTWSCGDPDIGDILTYDVIVGKENSPEEIRAEGISENSFVLGNCPIETMWYWQVIARDNNNAVTKSPVWCFMTNKSVPNNEMD